MDMDKIVMVEIVVMAEMEMVMVEMGMVMVEMAEMEMVEMVAIVPLWPTRGGERRGQESVFVCNVFWRKLTF